MTGPLPPLPAGDDDAYNHDETIDRFIAMSIHLLLPRNVTPLMNNRADRLRNGLKLDTSRGGSAELKPYQDRITEIVDRGSITDDELHSFLKELVPAVAKFSPAPDE